ncbi:MAG TPA: carboxypeptidase-like regulatory domain-containing protein [Gemmatimonadales bacterium]|nr:carboxypeptidase-like regulatory domain-containing protein [Gemmatimonadales bacterium]
MAWIHRSTIRSLLAVCAVAAASRGVAAQQRPDVVRGLVRSGGAAVPYAVVALEPARGQEFSDDSGAFRLAGVPPGAYRLLVRQIGFRPFDSTVVKVAAVPLVLSIEMQPLVVELSAITVTTSRACTAPGPPDSAAAPQLAALLEQIRENADRYAFLADSYPFRYRMSRKFADYDQMGRVASSSSDVVQLVSSNRVRYQPGYVVKTGLGPNDSLMPRIVLPTLSDFGDSVFQATHCFYYAGTVDRNGGRYVRFDYVPTEALRTPDIEGEVYLDALSFQIRIATVRLTRVGRAMPGLLSTSSTITFAELYPNVLIPRRVEGELVPEPRYDVRTPIARYTETQQLIDIRFERALPAAGPPGR